MNPNEIILLAGLDIQPAAEGKRPRFQILAYNGSSMWLKGFEFPKGTPCPVVIDLAGLDVGNQSIPILREHDDKTSSVSGRSDSIKVEGSNVIESGELYAAEDPEVEKIVAKAKAGHPWHASVGTGVKERENVPAGRSVAVNGQTFQGPLIVARKSILRETSIVTFGACQGTVVNIQAKNQTKEQEMDPKLKQKLVALGLAADADDFAAAAYAERPDIKAKLAESPIQASAPASIPFQAPGAQVEPQAVIDMRAAAAAEASRIAAVSQVCGSNDAIKAKAIGEGWSSEKAELEVLRASRAHVPNVATGSGIPFNGQVIEAAWRLNSLERRDTVAKDYDQRTLEAADRIRSSSIKGMIQACCKLSGVQVPDYGASPMEWANAAFSTSAFSGILSNTAHKQLIASYNAFPDIAKISRIAKKLSAADFKPQDSYRLDSATKFEEVGDGGEIRHGTIGDAKYSFQVNTYGKMIGITRKMIVNDDLNAFAELPMQLGRGAAQKLAALFWAMVVGNAGSFFSEAHKNLDDTHDAIDGTGYAAANLLMRKQVDANSEPLDIVPRFVVCPVALETDAMAMYSSAEMLASALGSTSVKKLEPTKNMWQGRFEPLASPRLDAAGGDAVADWYLLADPADVAAFGVAYLNGRETPVIEEVALSGEYLGKAWRGYMDFGVCQIDWRGAVKMS